MEQETSPRESGVVSALCKDLLTDGDDPEEMEEDLSNKQSLADDDNVKRQRMNDSGKMAIVCLDLTTNVAMISQRYHNESTFV